MGRPYNERRNQQVKVLIERRDLPQKDIARRLKLTWTNLRQIIYRLKKRDQSNVTKCNRIVVTLSAKSV